MANDINNRMANPTFPTLTPHQAEALGKLQAFSREAGARCFVLRGYAGTGKTTLLGHYVRWLREQGMRPVLLATTGRAAKVLSAKTGEPAATIHSCVYQFDELSGLDEAASAGVGGAGQLTLQFGVREPPPAGQPMVYIVDEASMIANTPAQADGHAARFGSGHLLVDFLAFSEGQRAVFVGDPCQLPPVSEDAFSPALSPRYLHEAYRVPVRYAELLEVLRQNRESEILRLAGRFRQDIIEDRYVNWPKIQPPRGETAFLYRDEQALIDAYLPYMRRHDYQEAMMIVNANGHCRRLNHRMRLTLQGNKNLAEGELLQVAQNSYFVPLANGDQVVVKSVRPAPAQAGFGFLKVKLLNLADDTLCETLLLRDLLYNDYAGLQGHETQRLLVDFDQRARRAGLRRKTDAYAEAMRKDPYLNALRAKFGYVVTCHKAQGGEWPQVFLNMHKSVYVQQGNALYRWFYTALTRPSQGLHLNDGFWVQGFEKRQPEAVKAFFKNRNRQPPPPRKP